MKIWEALEMLEQMDQTKECTVTFGKVKDDKPFKGYPGTLLDGITYTPNHIGIKPSTHYNETTHTGPYN